MKSIFFLILALLSPLVNFSQNSLGKIQDNTNLALPSSYNFVEYVFPEPDDEGSCNGVINSTASINEIFFSQLHRKSINHPFHFLIGHRPALFQLHVTVQSSVQDACSDLPRLTCSAPTNLTLTEYPSPPNWRAVPWTSIQKSLPGEPGNLL